MLVWAFVMTSEEMADANEGTAIEAAMTTKEKKILQFFLLLLDINRERRVMDYSSKQVLIYKPTKFCIEVAECH